VVVTVGSQQALDLITRIFVNPGDVVLAEGPSYVGALGTFASYQANVVHVPMDDAGLVPEALAETIGRLAAERQQAKFLYTVPSFHNPGGVTLTVERRPGCWRSASGPACS
jgi:DNA-binding transcriptional MocR family regulator